MVPVSFSPAKVATPEDAETGEVPESTAADSTTVTSIDASVLEKQIHSFFR